MVYAVAQGCYFMLQRSAVIAQFRHRKSSCCTFDSTTVEVYVPDIPEKQLFTPYLIELASNQL